MAAVIIKEKDVKRLGKEVLNEIFNFFNNEYILTEFKDMKKVKKKFLNNLFKQHINTLQRNFLITEEKRNELLKLIYGEKSLPNEMELKVNSIKFDGIDLKGKFLITKEKTNSMKVNGIDNEEKFLITKEKTKEILKLIDDEKSLPNEMELKINSMKVDGIDIEGIYLTLNSLKLDPEIDEDLYFKTKAFLDIYRVFNSGYSYLDGET